MLHPSRLLVAGILVVLLSAAVSYAVSAGQPSAFLPAGSTMYAVVSKSNQVSTTSSSFVAVPDMSKTITIPGGQRGDIFIQFCGASFAEYESDDIWVRAMVNSSIADPGTVTFYDGPIAVVTHCVVFNKTDVGEGNKTIKIQWHKQIPIGSIWMWGYRSLLVTVNIHP